MTDQGLKALLPEAIATRVQAARLADRTATIVLDAAGLGASARTDIEAAVKDILGQSALIDTVRVALMASKTERKILAVGSGKGGVGKSTLAANLAIAMARAGRKVGIVDADVYGPSQPTMLDNAGEKPEARDKELIPVPSRHGVPVLSMGHLVEAGQALAWRGPMAGNALGQLIDANWGDTEILVVDLPPGTGDVQLSMLSKHKPAGAVIISTPQDLALIDARRAAQLFESGKVPLLGLVENMSGYICPHCGEASDPFGTGGVESAAAEMGVPLLGRIPLAMDIREAGDAGVPPATGDGPHAALFADIAQRVLSALDAQKPG